MVKKAAEPFLYTDRRVELPEPVGAVPYEACQLAEIVAGIRTLVGRSDRMMEDAQRQVQGATRRMQVMLDSAESHRRSTLAELEELKSSIRRAIADGPDSISAWSAVTLSVGSGT